MAKDKKENPGKQKGTINRDASTGKFVTKSYASKHPKTTVSESVKKKGKGKGKGKGTDHTGPRRKK